MHWSADWHKCDRGHSTAAAKRAKAGTAAIGAQSRHEADWSAALNSRLNMQNACISEHVSEFLTRDIPTEQVEIVSSRQSI